MKKITLLILVIVTNLSSVIAQSKILKGHIIDGNTNKPVKNIWVSILGVDRTLTTDKGEYQLDISHCKHCGYGEVLTIYIQNDDYGFHESTITIPKNLAVNVITITPVPKVIGVFGIVRDMTTKNVISNIRVEVFSEDFEDPSYMIDPVYTNASGMFRILLRKDKVGSLKYMTLIFTDEKKEYFDSKEVKK